MRNSIHKWVSVILALTMITAIVAGCASPSTGGTKAPDKTTAPTKAGQTTVSPDATLPPEALDDPYGKYEDPIVLSVLSVDFKNVATEYDSTNPDRRSPSENAWINAYLEYLNIDIDRIIAEDATALNATINTSMASGDLPDVMVVDKAMFYNLVENGVLADLSEPYESYIADKGRLLRDCIATCPDVLLNGTFDGKLLGIPFFGGLYTNSDVLWVRQDWLDNVGMDPPSTIEQLIDIARAFKEAKFDGKDTIGLGITNVSSGYMAAFGAILGTWHQQEDGTYIYANTQDEVKDGLLSLQSVYKEGLVKSDFAVTNIIDEEIANGVVGMHYAPAWVAVTSIQANMNNDEDAVWVPVRIPSLDGGDIKQWTNEAITQFIVVNKDCEHPEAIFKMLELELHMYFEPTEEEALKYYYCEDGYQIWNFRIFRNFDRADKDHYKSELIIEALDSNKGIDEISLYAKESYKKVLEGLEKRSVYGFYLGFVIGHPVILEQREKGMLYGAYNGPLTENMTLYESTINEALTNAMLEVIMGADISVYEQAVETWYATGGQAITDDVNAYYKSRG